jgi:hypothetical protein
VGRLVSKHIQAKFHSPPTKGSLSLIIRIVALRKPLRQKVISQREQESHQIGTESFELAEMGIACRRPDLSALTRAGVG